MSFDKTGYQLRLLSTADDANQGMKWVYAKRITFYI